MIPIRHSNSSLRRTQIRYHTIISPCIHCDNLIKLSSQHCARPDSQTSYMTIDMTRMCARPEIWIADVASSLARPAACRLTTYRHRFARAAPAPRAKRKDSKRKDSKNRGRASPVNRLRAVRTESGMQLPDVVWPAAAERQPRARSARRGCCRPTGGQRKTTFGGGR